MTKEKSALIRRYDNLLRLMWTRADKIEEQADVLRKEISQVEYLLRDMLKEIV